MGYSESVVGSSSNFFLPHKSQIGVFFQLWWEKCKSCGLFYSIGPLSGGILLVGYGSNGSSIRICKILLYGRWKAWRYSIVWLVSFKVNGLEMEMNKDRLHIPTFSSTNEGLLILGTFQ